MKNSVTSVTPIIVSYNCSSVLAKCLRSLPVQLRVIVVDNASQMDGAAGVCCEFVPVTLITNKENRGFAAACNQGIRATTEPFVLLLNPDTVVSKDALQQLLAMMDEDEQIGACGPRILNEDGSLQVSVRRFPSLGRMLLAECGLRSAYYVQTPGRDVEQLMGACLLLRRAALDEVGLLDERFFIYFEEVDLCLRLKQGGWRVVHVPEAEITHSGGQSSKTAKEFSVLHRYRSLFAFYRKHYPAWHLFLLKLVIQIAALPRIVLGQTRYAIVARKVWQL